MYKSHATSWEDNDDVERVAPHEKWASLKYLLTSRGQFRVDDGQAFQHRHVTEFLIRADEIIDRNCLMGVQGDG